MPKQHAQGQARVEQEQFGALELLVVVLDYIDHLQDLRRRDDAVFTLHKTQAFAFLDAHQIGHEKHI